MSAIARLKGSFKDGRKSATGVRREKAAFSSGCKSHPASAQAGSYRSNCGGNETVEAFGKCMSRIGDSASVQAATRMNAEQACRCAGRPGNPFGEGRYDWGIEQRGTQSLRRGSGGSMYTRKTHATREAPRRV